MSQPEPHPSYRPLPELATAESVLEWIRQRVQHLAPQSEEHLPLEAAINRIGSRSVRAPHALPPFRRAMMDGVAIRHAELQNVYEFQITVDLQTPGAAHSVQTGSEVSPEMDTVVPFEHLRLPDGTAAQSFPPGVRFKVIQSVNPRQHIAPIGEDLAEGQLILEAKQRLRLKHVGLLAALGISEISCLTRPTVELLLTGDELLPPDQVDGNRRGKPAIQDANGPALRALLQRDQADLIDFQVLGDQPEQLKNHLDASQADLLLVTGGTSVGPDDHATRCLTARGKLCFHGIDIRPGRPTAIGTMGKQTVILLPGNPIACFFGYELLVRPFLQQWQHQNLNWPYPCITVPLAADVLSREGRVDFLRVTLREKQAHPITTGRASNLSTLAFADGFSVIPAHTSFLKRGQSILVYQLQ